ncbi:unnamed protein product [Adineta steineri]|uniref:Uncharacterized protein n=2 Tax=Adineta steineri TaxID=433720 RepID=A0A815NNJ2_9BILA|nr:unnamed protein product [Adineta steineri]
MKPELRTITVLDITPVIFNETFLKYGETLSCPCSKVAIPYKDFVNHTITYHPICSSIFVSEQWIQALYVEDASRYGTGDFRSTANSQFHLLATLCSLSEDVISQNKFDFDNNEFISSDLLPDVQVQSKINATLDVFKSHASTRIMLLVNYLRTTIRANHLVSSLNTNFIIQLSSSERGYLFFRRKVHIAHSIASTLKPTTMDCSIGNPIAPISFFSDSKREPNPYHLPSYFLVPNATLVSGFFAGCTPFEALLQSTLDCLYSIDCLELLMFYFPNITQIHIDWTNSTLPSKQDNKSVNDHLVNLFIDDCLYGGLIIILRLIAPFLVNIWLKLKYHSINTNINPNFFMTCIRKFGQFIKRLNLFKAADRRMEADIKQQKISTYVYLTLLTGSFFILLYTSWSTDVVIKTDPNPSLTTYKKLEAMCLKKFECSCSNTILPYEKFILLSPIFHQICSSDLITDEWISLLRDVTTGYDSPDWRNIAHSHFHLLSDLCKLANTTIEDAIQRLLLQSFIVSNVLTENDFNIQLNATLNEFFRSTIIYFSLLLKTVKILTQIDQLYSVPMTHIKLYQEDENLVGKFTIDNNQRLKASQVTFRLIGPRNVNSTSFACICATDTDCQYSFGIYDVDNGWSVHPTFFLRYTVPGLVFGCSPVESLILSTLQCFYSHSTCFSILMNYSRQQYLMNVEHPTWFDVRPLVYDPIRSRFPPNTPILTIVEEIMIEQWNLSFSYDHFYKSCAPNYCTYTKRIRRKFVEIMIKLLSMIGGLTLCLHLLTPKLISFIFYLLTKICNQQQQEQEEEVFVVRYNIFSQLQIIIQKLITYLYTKLVNLNIFFVRDFGSNIDRTTAKRLGQWATRLYMILLVVGISVLAAYIIFQPETLTKKFDQPSLDLYNQLFQRYGDELKCSCPSITSTYNRFVTVEAIFHQICSSPFASNAGRINLTSGLTSDLSAYLQEDYRRFISAHLQFLTGLCQLSNDTVHIAIQQFYSSLFIINKLLSKTKFNTHIDSIIETSKSNAHKAFTQLLFLIRNVNHGNAFVSTYGTNFEYFIPMKFFIVQNVHYAYTKPLSYDDKCSCGLYSNCTTEANFIEGNFSKIIPIKGLKMGCTPSESFLQSTLECFYNQSCIDLIQKRTNINNNLTYSFVSLSTTNTSRFLINTTIDKLIEHSFIEEWKRTINYSHYFEQCSPLICSYTYIKKFNLFHTITALLGLQGGLTIILQWISPKIIRIINKIYQYRKKRINPIQPIYAVDTIPIENVDTFINRTNSIVSVRYHYKIIFICVLLLTITAVLVLFSINIARPENNPLILTVSSTTSTTMDTSTNSITNAVNSSTTPIVTTSMITTIRTTHKPTCSLKFQQISIKRPSSWSNMYTYAIADFNGDKQLDLAGSNRITRSINVLLGTGNANFQPEIESLTRQLDYMDKMVVGDFNNDNRLDLACTSQITEYVFILLANSNGGFNKNPTLYLEEGSTLSGIIVTHFNGDGYLDIAVTNAPKNSLHVFFGKGDGTFFAEMTFHTGINSYPIDIAVADFNRDGCQDIAVVNQYSRNIGIFLGRGNGSFEVQKTFSTGHYYDPSHLVVGDFNSDTLIDIAVSYEESDFINVMVGYSNGTVDSSMKFHIGTPFIEHQMSVSDFNDDHCLDIVFADAQKVLVFVGDGNGHFETQSVFLLEKGYIIPWLGIADFNDDSYDDIIYMDKLDVFEGIFLNKCK